VSVIDDVQRANQRFAEEFRLGHLPMRPAKQLAIVACMDARLTIEPALGLKTGDAHIIRNAGGIVTEDAIRSLLISHYLLGTEEWMIVNHTDCGMLTFKEEELLAKLRAQSDTTAVTPVHFHAFRDLEENVRQQIQKVQSHPWVPSEIMVRGFVYDVRTGKLREVAAAGSPVPR
jgi:carbonic anhydrase